MLRKTSTYLFARCFLKHRINTEISRQHCNQMEQKDKSIHALDVFLILVLLGCQECFGEAILTELSLNHRHPKVFLSNPLGDPNFPQYLLLTGSFLECLQVQSWSGSISNPNVSQAESIISHIVFMCFLQAVNTSSSGIYLCWPCSASPKKRSIWPS